MKKLFLNCDLGESFGPWKMGMDEKIMPLIDMANIACGFHASDPSIMFQTVTLAKQNNVSIGAHPGYPDLVGFGRRSMHCSAAEIEAFVTYQIGALAGICKAQDVEVSYVKPHGALYNDMMKNDTILLAIAKAISNYDRTLKLMILSTGENARYEELVAPLGVELIYEVFADRGYTDEGFLVPRSEQGALIHDTEAVIDRIKLLESELSLITRSGKKIQMQADSMCVHGDNEEALALVKALREYLNS